MILLLCKIVEKQLFNVNIILLNNYVNLKFNIIKYVQLH